MLSACSEHAAFLALAGIAETASGVTQCGLTKRWKIMLSSEIDAIDVLTYGVFCAVVASVVTGGCEGCFKGQGKIPI